jgi:predicted transcriptional regulator
MKAIIDIAKRGSVFSTARAQLANRNELEYRLSFESAKSLFTELTPARFDLLDVLRRAGPCSVYALAKEAGRNYSNVHADTAKLLNLGLIERTDDDTIHVPFSTVEIHMELAKAA